MLCFQNLKKEGSFLDQLKTVRKGYLIIADNLRNL
jgi:hypothetical protein